MAWLHGQALSGCQMRGSGDVVAQGASGRGRHGFGRVSVPGTSIVPFFALRCMNGQSH